jgi:hypothetical protein
MRPPPTTITLWRVSAPAVMEYGGEGEDERLRMDEGPRRRKEVGVVMGRAQPQTTARDSMVVVDAPRSL